MGLREGRLLLGEGLLCLPSPRPHAHIPDPVAARKSLEDYGWGVLIATEFLSSCYR